jgi:D-xylono/L-arabinono-1,4-lactonase
MISSIPAVVADYANDTGEGPVWHPSEKAIYWTDIPGRRVFRYFPEADLHEQVIDGVLVGGMTIQQDGSLLLYGEHGAVWSWQNGELSPVIAEILAERGTRFNDVGVDPAGRVFCGTMNSDRHPGRLYRLNHDTTLDCIIEGVGISNGIGFSLDHKTMYYSESVPRLIHAFDYDVTTGSLTNRRLFASALPDDGIPDGLTVDAEGNIWSARWDGFQIVKYSHDGAIVARIKFPVPKVSSCIFGGGDYTDLYVTTAGGLQKETEGQYAGALFVLKNAGRGVPDFLSKIAVPGQ